MENLVWLGFGFAALAVAALIGDNLDFAKLKNFAKLISGN